MLARSPLRIAFIGPSSAAMRSLGDKIASTIVAQSAGVPTMEWSGKGLVVKEHDGLILDIPASLYRQACIETVEEGLAVSRRIGYPLMIKASEGGGGKGIRRVDVEDDFSTFFQMVQREVPGSPIFLMKLAVKARHLEVQVLADQHGSAISLYGRDCSVQRRHQKIIEEAPVTIASEETFEQMELAAIRLAQLVGYESTGTVEYLYNPDYGSFCFLELNPRLQVEHPTTEMVSRVNLPAAQLQVAMGVPLHCIADIRRLYRQDPEQSTSIDFTNTKRIAPRGHVIAARITAENPDAGFKPSSGRLMELNFRGNSDVWGYFSVGVAGGLHEYADSQFGHIFAYGQHRNEARRNMVMALKEMSIRGDFRTTVEYLVKLLEMEAFCSNTITTAWLDDLIKQKFTSERPDRMTVIVCGAVCLASKAFGEQAANCILMLEKKQLPGAEFLRASVPVHFVYENMQYRLMVTVSGDAQFALDLNGSTLSVSALKMTDGGLLIAINGKNQVTYWKEEPESIRLTINSRTCLITKESDPSVIRSPSSGKLVKYLVTDRSHVGAGRPIAEMEVMKMYMPLVAPESGTINLMKQPGSTIEVGDILAILKLDNPSQINKVVNYTGTFADGMIRRNSTSKERIIQHWQQSITALHAVLDGCEDPTIEAHLNAFFLHVRNPGLPVLEVSDLLSNVIERIPSDVGAALTTHIGDALEQQENLAFSEFAHHFGAVLKGCDLECLQPIKSFVSKFECDKPDYGMQALIELIEHFVKIEALFDGVTTNDHLMARLGKGFGDNYELARRALASHAKLNEKMSLLVKIIDRLFGARHEQLEHPSVERALRKLTSFENIAYNRIICRSREILLYAHLPSWRELEVKMAAKFKAACELEGAALDKFITEMVERFSTHLDVLPRFFHHPNPKKRLLSAEIYIRRIYESGHVQNTSCMPCGSSIAFCWSMNKLENTLSPLCRGLVALDGQREEGAVLQGGLMVSVNSLLDALDILPNVERVLKDRGTERNVVYLAINQHISEDMDIVKEVKQFLQARKESLEAARIRRITLVLVQKDNAALRYFTFRSVLEFSEDCTVRHIEPAMSYLLELTRISANYDHRFCYADASGQAHVYVGTSKDVSRHTRLFIRILIRPIQTMISQDALSYFAPEAHRLLENVFEAVEAVHAAQKVPGLCNHVFFNILPIFYTDPAAFMSMFRALMDVYRPKFLKLRILQGEVRLNVAKDRNSPISRCRFVMSNESGFLHEVAGFYERKDLVRDQWILHAFHARPGSPFAELDGQCSQAPYPLMTPFQLKRYRVQAMETSYVYDFPLIFRRAVEMAWENHRMQCSIECEGFVSAQEFDLQDGKLVPVNRPPGNNTCGMVVWRMTLRTPECPEGRPIIVIANDMSFQIGSFGVPEDRLFYAASELGRQEGIPRIYLSANSGARLGMSEGLKGLFKVAWIDPADPTRGFDYLYLTDADAAAVSAHVLTEPLTTASGERRHKIGAIIGEEDNIGVENLMGSGLIAGETSRAYNEIFTLTFVTCRSVGIGAYLVRLGQRVIQKAGQPIILTGVAALNKLLGREVYVNNLQIGGPQVMLANGVSHLVVQDDLEGVYEIIRWLSFVPLTNKLPKLPILIGNDSDPERPVEYDPDENADPRLLFLGFTKEDGQWLGGLMDRGSFRETLSGWAKSVVCGRARLGGIPLAVIVPETRTTETVVPADPANAKSEAQVVPQAGQIWFPDSAFKTAQFIRDCDRERLPLMIVANWRGFSGGQRDLFDSILKFGSFIVDALREYRQPVIVYLVPRGELRGGAWVVLDTSINPEMIEMYADSDARGGIMEPAGVVSIKYRTPQLVEAMERLDGQLSELVKRREANKEAIQQRIKQLLPIYTQIASHYADCHDKVGRMLAKGAVRAAVPWTDTRRVFYRRLKHRLAEEDLLRQCQGAFGTSRADFFSWLGVSTEEDAKGEAYVSAMADQIRTRARQQAIARLESELSRL